MADNKNIFTTIAGALGVSKTTEPKANDYTNKNINLPHSYNEKEQDTLNARHILPNKTKSSPRQSTSVYDGVISAMSPDINNAMLQIIDADRLKELVPEISAAETILISSIMSPNDLQEAKPIFKIEDVENINDDAIIEIEQLLETFFTKNHKLPGKMTEWFSDALFRSGSVSNLILPEANLKDIIASARTGEEIAKYSTSEEMLSYENYSRLVDNTSVELNKVLSIESIYSSNRKDKKDNLSISQEQLSYYKSLVKDDLVPSNENNLSNYNAGLEKLVVTIKKEIEEGDLIKISENPEIIRFGTALKENVKNLSANRVMSKYPTSKLIKEEKILNLQYYNSEDKSVGHPFVLQIPTESVIPVCIPGSITDKIGYFVVLDSQGHPLEAKKYLASISQDPISARISNAYNAMYGNKPTITGIKNNFNNFSNLQNTYQADPMARIFNELLDEKLKGRLDTFGFKEIQFEQYNAISACMFYRALERKKTTLVFVPTEFMSYLAFDYRDNGTGKNLLEDVKFLIALRATLLVANTMAAMRNAVPKKEITIGMAEDETNYTQVLETMKNEYLRKYGDSLFSTDPNLIVKNILSQNLVVKTLPNPNVPGFTVDMSDTNPSVVQADVDMLNKYDSWISSALNITPSMANALNGDEFAVSVVTNNLVFSKKVKKYQDKGCDILTDYVQKFVKYSSKLQYSILEILKSSLNIKDDEDIVSDGDATLNKTDNVNKLLIEIINNITVSLPAPNLAPDTARIKILQDLMGFADTVIESLLSENLVLQDDTNAKDGLVLLKANLKLDLTKQMLDEVGFDYSILTNLDDYIIDKCSENNNNFLSLSSKARNLKLLLEKDKTTKETTNESRGGSFDNDEDSYGGFPS